jgi:hypothetical protein
VPPTAGSRGCAHVAHLQQAGGQQAGDDHHGEADIAARLACRYRPIGASAKAFA